MLWIERIRTEAEAERVQDRVATREALRHGSEAKFSDFIEVHWTLLLAVVGACSWSLPYSTIVYDMMPADVE
jgi:hypothetical protein